MERMLIRSLLIISVLVLGACQKAPTFSLGTNPPGHPAADSNPIPVTALTTVTGCISQQGQSVENNGNQLQLPARPCGQQGETRMLVNPGA